MKKLKIGMIGYGGIGRVHAMAYRAITYHYGLPADTFQIVGVATSNPTTAQKAAEEIGCDYWTDDYYDLLKRDDIDLIDCCVPNHKHEEVITAIAKAGKHVYCEKPLSVSLDEGQRMATIVEQAGIKSQMTFNFRFFPAIIRARQLIEEGFVGNVFSFRGRYYRSSYIDREKPMSWRLKKDISGGGALFDLGSHILDLVYHLLGDFGSVQATLDTLIRERPIAKGAEEKAAVEVDDIALLHLRMADSTLGLVEISRMGTGLANSLEVEIFGDKGAIRFNAADPSWLEVYDVRDEAKPLGGMRGFKKLETIQHYESQKAPDWSMSPSFVRTHVECQYAFLRAVQEDLTPSPTISDGLKIQEVMEASVRSSDEKRWVSMEELRS